MILDLHPKPTTWLDDLHRRADEALNEADELMADAVCREAARALCTDRLSEGHVLAIEGHVRALVAGFGLEWARDWCEALTDALSDAIREGQAWERLPAPKRRGKPVARAAIEEAVGN